MQLHMNLGEPYNDQLGKVCLNKTKSETMMLFEANYIGCLSPKFGEDFQMGAFINTFYLNTTD